MSLVALLWIALVQSFVPTGTDPLAHRGTATDRASRAIDCACPPAAHLAPAERSVRTPPARLGGRSHADRVLALAPATLTTARGGPPGTGAPSVRAGTGAGWVIPPFARGSVRATIRRADAATVDHTSRVVAARGGLVPYFLIPPPIG